MAYDLVVVGLGYVGLPLAVEASRAGLSVAGFDVSAGVVSDLSAGRSHIGDVSADDLAKALGEGFIATSDPSVIATADAIVICVPTPLTSDGGPDLTAVRSALETVAAHVRKGALVSLESTTYPGTTEEVALPLLERSGLKVGTDLHLAFSPERIDAGNAKFGVRNTPKVVGGVTPECTEAAATLYGRFIDTIVRARGTREAEMAKLLENTYRHVNIALVNELARYCDDLDIDVWDVIRCASSKPFGFQTFWPGPGVGGHCIPVDPGYLAYKVMADLGEQAGFIALAQNVNNAMPAYVVRRCQDLLNENGRAVKGSRVLLLGVAYKNDISDTRESPAHDVARGFARLGAEVSYHDPYVPTWETPALGLMTSVGDLPAALDTCDLAVLLQAHRTYDVEEIVAKAKLVFDTRGVVSEAKGVRRL